jgi:hypothetical protein
LCDCHGHFDLSGAGLVLLKSAGEWAAGLKNPTYALR